MKTRIRPCDECGGKIGPDFYVVKVAQGLVDYAAVNRHLGLAQMLQSAALAEVLGPDEALERIVAGEDANGWPERVLCQRCFVEQDLCVRVWVADGGNAL